MKSVCCTCGRLRSGFIGGTLDESCLFQRDESTIFGDGFERSCAQFDCHEAVFFGNPDALVLEVGEKRPRHHFGDMLADSAFFLRETATVNDGALCGLSFGNTANSAHDSLFLLQIGAGTCFN